MEPVIAHDSSIGNRLIAEIRAEKALQQLRCRHLLGHSFAQRQGQQRNVKFVHDQKVLPLEN